MLKYNILCFSFAGGSRYSFHSLKQFCPKDFELIPLDYPGRGLRSSEPLLRNIDDIVADMYHQIAPFIRKPYMIYGHSMGGLVAYKMALFLKSRNERTPDCMLITGCRAPSTWDQKKGLHDLHFDELIIELRNMGGIPEEILQDRDSMMFFEPILRADFSVVESFKYEIGEALDVPIKVITGLNEDITEEEALRWQDVTSVPLECKRFEGGHFFILDCPDKIANEMQASRNRWGKKKIDHNVAV